MARRNDIPHLIELLDDESPSVREHVLRELMSFGPALESEVQALDSCLTPEQRRRANRLLCARRHAESRWLAWRSWPQLPDPYEQIEQALSLLAEFQYGWTPPVRLRELLDALADEYLQTCRSRDGISLSRFLFVTKRLRGNQDDYYNPLNSNLIHVIQQGAGLPLSLTCVFMLVGRRTGVRVEGCNTPGHFLARVPTSGGALFFDCYNGGRMLNQREVGLLRGKLPSHRWHVMTEPATPGAIIQRVLHNLIHAYELEGNLAFCGLMRDLLGHCPSKR
jgi:hypothetical protein